MFRVPSISMVFMATALFAGFAAGPAAAQSDDSVLVWGISAVSEVPQEYVDRLSSSLTDVVGRTTGLDVADEEDVDEGINWAMDNGECQENNMACVIEVANGLELRDAVSGDLGMVGDVYVLTIRRINVQTGTVAMQVTGQTDEGIDTLLQSLPDMVATLYNIPHNSLGTVRTDRYEDSYRYVIVTYGRPFHWLEPTVYVGMYPWWWAGPIHYYHHHHYWHGWHYRHPAGRPHYTGPRRPHPGRHHHGVYRDGDRPRGDRPHHDRHDGDRRDDRHDGDRRDDRHDGDRRDDRTRQDLRMPAGGQVHDNDRRGPTPVDRGRTDIDRPRPSDRPGRDVTPGPARPGQPAFHTDPRPQGHGTAVKPGDAGKKQKATGKDSKKGDKRGASPVRGAPGPRQH